MGNKTTKESYERRLQVEELWIRGERSICKIAQAIGCGYYAVKQDLVLLRREHHHKAKKVELDLIKLEIDRQYLAEMIEINNLIQKILERPKVETAKIKGEKIIEGAKAILVPNYNAIVGLKRIKMDLIYKRAELWELIKMPSGIHVSASASASAEASVNTGKKISDLMTKDEKGAIDHVIRIVSERKNTEKLGPMEPGIS